MHDLINVGVFLIFHSKSIENPMGVQTMGGMLSMSFYISIIRNTSNGKKIVAMNSNSSTPSRSSQLRVGSIHPRTYTLDKLL